ncbi:alpha-L-rhamnosidase C-terminal domain-containing protein [Cohnella boryungensis]|uniref:Alpha-L-rhamnosidase C-terminal domain-containing protein n=1 Tax=Cohnella boryungensis TaxID=768479 RepID=A0ABV8SHG7_9BACL
MKPSWEEEAKWIWAPDWKPEDEAGVGRFVYFRKTVNLGEGDHSCIVRVSADSRYLLFVNGKAVSRGPCKGDRFAWYYETVEVGDLLVEGTNVFAVQVLRYPYAGGGNESVWRTPLPGLYVHADIRDEKGALIATAHTDESWHCARDESIGLSQGVYTQFLGITETVDGAKRPFGWESASFDAGRWSEVVAYTFDILHGGLKPWVLTDRPIPVLYETWRRFNKASRLRNDEAAWQQLLESDRRLVIPSGSSVLIDLDAGELTTGYIQLRMSGGKGTVVKLLCAECYENEPISVPWLRDKGDRTDNVNGDLYGDADEYKAAGAGTAVSESFEDYEPFWFRTFRYVRLEIKTGDESLTLHRCAYRETGYPLNVAAEYRSSDPQESALWEISVRTLRRCMHETYEDCPYYEQLQYAMDTRSQILFTYYLAGDDRLARRTFYDFHSSMLPQGLTQSRYPSVSAQVIPGFSLYWIFMLHDHMMFAGDRELIERYLPGVDAVLGYFHRMRDGSGLVGPMDASHWSFVDWAHRWKESYGVPGAAKRGPLTVNSLMYAYALQQAADLASFAGRSGLASEYVERAEQIRQAVKTRCMSGIRRGCLTDGPGIEEYSQHSQIWAVLVGVLEGEDARHAMGTAINDSSFVPCSFAMAFYLFRALSAVGMYDRVNGMLEPWRKMSADGLTTWMEDTVSQRSDAHAWGSVPIYEYAAETLGVRPVAPGYGEIEIRPFIGHLQHAKGRIMTAKGAVDVAWRCMDGRFHLSAAWPADVPCTVSLPDGQSVRIENEGKYDVEIELPQPAAPGRE